MADLAGTKVAYLGYCGVIDSAGVGKIAAALNVAVNEQFDGVHLCISTLGGYVGDGIYLYNHIRSLPLPVTLHNTGTVASIGTTLFTAAERRLCARNAVFMMHPVAFPSDGQSAERIQAALAAVTSDETRTEEILRERTVIPDNVLFQRRVTNVYVTADQALEFGLIHEIADFSLPPGNKIFNI
jgi:ATP-dependent Clp protease protease subunit